MAKFKVGDIVTTDRKGFENARCYVVEVGLHSLSTYAFRKGKKVTKLSMYYEGTEKANEEKRTREEYKTLFDLAVDMHDEDWFNRIYEQFILDHGNW